MSCDKNSSESKKKKLSKSKYGSIEAVYNDMLSEDLFNESKVHTFSFTIQDSLYDKINRNPKKEEFVSAYMQFNSSDVGPVSIRYKGNHGAWKGCVASENEGVAAKDCIKLSLKVKIKKGNREGVFAKTRRLQLHHMNSYPDQMTERLAYWFYREMGVVAPRAVHVKVFINNKYSGLYTMVEQIDKYFIKRNFKKHKGSLYKDYMPLTQVSSNKIVGVLKGYVEQYSDVDFDRVVSTRSHLKKYLKYPSKSRFKHTVLNEFENELSDAVGEAAAQVVLQEWFYLQQLVNHVITAAALNHWDTSYFRDKIKNNFWFENHEDHKIHMIPWDTDWCSFYLGPDNLKAFSEALQCKSTRENKLARNWLCDKELTQRAFNRLFEDVYPKAFKMIDQWKNQIGQATTQGENEYGMGAFPNTAAVKVKDWEQAVEGLKNRLIDNKHQLQQLIQYNE
ncbi:MAG: CotH kinase family protein [Fibrobacterales bacterium]